MTQARICWYGAAWSPVHQVQSAMRLIVRWVHIVLGVPIIGYVYSPFEELPNYAAPTRFVFLPALVLTGLWMWKGHVLRRLISR